MLTDFCQGQYAQKLLSVPVDPIAAFADYTRLAPETPHPHPYLWGLTVTPMSSLWILRKRRLDVPEGGIARGHHVDDGRTA
jgi:hypothetical protein